MTMRVLRLLGIAVLLAFATVTSAQTCGGSGIGLQVLGSGGPELAAKRAASSYLVWIDGKARVLVDTGGGSALRFGESGAQMRDLDVVLFTHLRADHASDLPALVDSSWFEGRTRTLPIYGPPGNRVMPSTVAFVRNLFDSTRGAYRSLGEFLSPLDKSSYKLEPHDAREPPLRIGAPRRTATPVFPVFSNPQMTISALMVSHGTAPALAFRVEAGGKAIVFAAGNSGNEALPALALNADLLIAHDAIPENSSDAQRAQYMPPSLIGRTANAAHARQLVLSHRTPATLGHEDETLAAIRKAYAGPVHFADDLSCYLP